MTRTCRTKTGVRAFALLLTASIATALGCGGGGPNNNFGGFPGNAGTDGTGGGAGSGGTGGGGTGGTLGDLTVEGTITAPSFSFIDGDTNDPNNPRVGNNLANDSDFQTIGNPAVLGGYLGRLEQGDDVEDWYSVTLAAGQGVTLFTADPVATDFDLYLFNSEFVEVGSSINTEAFDWVVAETGGQFFVAVTSCYDGNCSAVPGLYNLTVGTVSVDSAAAPRLSREHEFVEGDVLVSEGDQVNALKARGADGWSQLNDRLDVKLERHTPVVERWRVRSRSTPVAAKSAAMSPLMAATSWSPTMTAIKALRRAGTTSASPNYLVQATSIPNDEHYPLQWHYPLIGLEQAWDVSQGDGVVVAVIDTGILSNHPDMQGQLVAGYDYISDASRARDGDGVDPDPEDPGDLANNGQSSSFHGTHVAGTIAARTNNGQGVAGVAPNAKVMPVRVLGLGGGSTFDICQAMLYAAGLPNASNSGASPPADILNLSLGGGPINPCEVDVIARARARGVFVVVAAGNDNWNIDNESLGGIADAFTVSAVDLHKAKSPYSSFGNRVDMAAPGGDISVDDNQDGFADGVLSLKADDSGSLSYGYYFEQGTSMAAPHVAGVIALMKSVNPQLTPADLDMLLQGTHTGTSIPIVEDLGAPGHDQVFGYGLIDALGAVRAAGALIGVAVTDPVLQVSPQSLELSSTQPRGTITVRNGGAGDLTVDQVIAEPAWLSVEGPAQNGAGSYVVTANTNGIPDGIYLGTISFQSNGGGASVSVQISVGAPSVTGGSVGTLYVLLVDDQYEALAQAVTSASDGYRYSLSGVAPGTYAIFAGTDVDNNGYIDDLGEALGGFPTLSDPRFIEVTDSLTGIDFVTGFEGSLFADSFARESRATPAPRKLRRR